MRLVQKIKPDSSGVGPVSDRMTPGESIIGSWAAMVGAMILARAVEDRDLSDRILKETHNFVAASLAQGDTDAPAGSQL